MAKASVVYNPSAVYEEHLRDMRAKRQTYTRPAVAPNDKIGDLRKEPSWLLPELRCWMAIPMEERARKINNVIEANEKKVYDKETKERCLRFILTQETERSLMIKIVNFLAPAAKG